MQSNDMFEYGRAESEQGHSGVEDMVMIDGQETARLVSKLSEHIDSKISSHLREPNVVLTLAGARGRTEFFIENFKKSDLPQIERLNELLQNVGMRVYVVGEINQNEEKNSQQMVSLESLIGYERVSQQSKIPGIIPFNSKTGWDGLDDWIKQCLEGVELAIGLGQIEAAAEDLPHIVSGVLYGYPDLAILDLMKADLLGDRGQLVYTEISFSDENDGANPNFMVDKKHLLEPRVQEVIEHWGMILRDFYHLT